MQMKGEAQHRIRDMTKQDDTSKMMSRLQCELKKIRWQVAQFAHAIAAASGS